MYNTTMKKREYATMRVWKDSKPRLKIKAAKRSKKEKRNISMLELIDDFSREEE